MSRTPGCGPRSSHDRRGTGPHTRPGPVATRGSGRASGLGVGLRGSGTPTQLPPRQVPGPLHVYFLAASTGGSEGPRGSPQASQSCRTTGGSRSGSRGSGVLGSGRVPESPESVGSGATLGSVSGHRPGPTDPCWCHPPGTRDLEEDGVGGGVGYGSTSQLPPCGRSVRVTVDQSVGTFPSGLSTPETKTSGSPTRRSPALHDPRVRSNTPPSHRRPESPDPQIPRGGPRPLRRGPRCTGDPLRRPGL